MIGMAGMDAATKPPTPPDEAAVAAAHQIVAQARQAQKELIAAKKAHEQSLAVAQQNTPPRWSSRAPNTTPHVKRARRRLMRARK